MTAGRDSFATAESPPPDPADDPLNTTREPSSSRFASPHQQGSDPPCSPLRRLCRLLSVDRADIWSVVVFAVANGALLLATPIAVQALVNFVAFGGSIPPLTVVATLLFAGLGLAAALTATQTWIVEILQRRLFVRMLADLTTQLPRVTLQARNHGYGPELVNRFFDIVTVQKAGSTLLLDGLNVLLTVLVGLIVLAFYHPLLLAFDVVLLGIILALVAGPSRAGVRTAIKESKTKYAVAAWLEEVARNPLAFKASGADHWVFSESDRLAHDYISARRSHFRVLFGQTVGALLLQAAASTTLLFIGGLLVIKGSLTLGQLVAAELIVTMVVSSVAKLGKHLEGYYDLMAAVQKIGDLLDLPMESTDGEYHPSPAGAAHVQAHNVACPETIGSPRIESLEFVLEPGSRLAVIGHSGSGRSHLLEMLWGLDRPERGAFRLDGRDLRDLSPSTIRRDAHLVLRTEVVAGTVRDNIRLGRPWITDDDVRVATEGLGLRSALVNMPNGLDTQLSPDGFPLSTGQLQMLMVARAVAGRPRLVLFGGSLDQLSEEDHARVCDSLMGDEVTWTLVLVSNDPRLLSRCDFHLKLPKAHLVPVSPPSRDGDST